VEPIAAPKGAAPKGTAAEGAAVELGSSGEPLTAAPDLRTTAAAARLFLPNLELGSDMPGREAAWARPTSPAAAPPAAAPQAPAAAPAVAVAPKAATAANLQALETDPLAGLKAMSESELIALFS
jgi:hypothetical protein